MQFKTKISICQMKVASETQEITKMLERDGDEEKEHRLSTCLKSPVWAPGCTC